MHDIEHQTFGTLKYSGFGNIYCSAAGEVFSFRKSTSEVRRRALTMRKGYWRVSAYLGSGCIRSRYVHKLVIEAFLGPTPKGQLVRHLNGVSTDNRIENLAFGTAKDNYADAVRHGSYLNCVNPGNTRFNEALVREFRRLYASGRTLADIAIQFDTVKSTVWYAIRRREHIT